MLTKRTFLHCFKHFQTNYCGSLMKKEITRKINVLPKNRSCQKFYSRIQCIKYALTNAA